MDKQKLKVLILDIEGGHGGSSKSIFYSVKNCNSDLVDIEIWCKKYGVIEDWYQKIDKKISIVEDMPRINSYKKFWVNIFEILKYFFNFRKSNNFRKKLVSISANFDIIHLNHYSLAHLAFWLKPKINCKIVMHGRVMLPNNFFSKLQCKMISRGVDKLVFITENERENFRKLGCQTEGSVIYNICEPPRKEIKTHVKLINENRFKVLCIGNYSYERGIDRLIEVAKDLKSRKVNNVVFLIVGETKIVSFLKNKINKIYNFQDLVKKHDLESFFIFFGHTINPENIIASSDILIRPSRKNDPWGRDVIEAMTYEIPILACGVYQNFIEHNLNGFLYPKFNVTQISDDVIKLMNNRELKKLLGKNGKDKARLLFDKKKNSEALIDVWQSLKN